MTDDLFSTIPIRPPANDDVDDAAAERAKQRSDVAHDLGLRVMVPMRRPEALEAWRSEVAAALVEWAGEDGCTVADLLATCVPARALSECVAGVDFAHGAGRPHVDEAAREIHRMRPYPAGAEAAVRAARERFAGLVAPPGTDEEVVTVRVAIAIALAWQQAEALTVAHIRQLMTEARNSGHDIDKAVEDAGLGHLLV